MLNKLFKPRAPKSVTFEEGVKFHVNFPIDYSKPQVAPVIPLIEQVRAAVQELSEQVAAIPKHSELDAVSIEHARDKVAAAQKAIEKAQAQCRAGLIEMADISPLIKTKEALHSALRALLARQQERDKRAVLVERLNDLRKAAQ